MYSHVVECHRGGKTLMRPLGPSDRAGNNKGDFHYYFGDDFLVVADSRGYARRTVTLPAGKWRVFLRRPDAHRRPDHDLARLSARRISCVRPRGAIVPLDVSRPYTGLGDRESAGLMTWNIYPADGNQFTLHRADGTSTTARVEQKDGLTITLSGARMPTYSACWRKLSPPR